MDAIAVTAIIFAWPDILRAASKEQCLPKAERRKIGRHIRRSRKAVKAMEVEARETMARWREEGLIP